MIIGTAGHIDHGAAGRFEPPWVRYLALTARAPGDEVRAVLRKCVIQGA